MPVKDSRIRMKLLTLASGHGRCTTVTPKRTLVSAGEWPLHGVTGGQPHVYVTTAISLAEFMFMKKGQSVGSWGCWEGPV
jgi:hypothetical protein